MLRRSSHRYRRRWRQQQPGEAILLFRIAETFTDSLARLTAEEQKAVKTTAFDLQVNPASPGMSFHRLDKAKDKNFWSVRVSSDLRLIVHKNADSLLLCFVGHHDKAYDWAARRKLETHPRTGAAQMVEVRERVEEIILRQDWGAAATAAPRRSLFAAYTDHELLGYGVPVDWLDDVRRADEDSLLELADHLPGEAAEALIELATGGRPARSPLGGVASTADHDAYIEAPRFRSRPSRDSKSLDSLADERLPIPEFLIAPSAKDDGFSHPDAQRRFRLIESADELERAFAFPWDKWTIFLHPAQRELVEHDYAGPARVSGSAGTGKTIVALHRAAFLARKNPDCRVLLTTFSETLANALRTRVRRLISNEPRLAERLDVHALDAVASRLYEAHVGRPDIASRDEIRKQLAAAAGNVSGVKFSPAFIWTEWDEVVDAWQIDSWEAYRDVKRLGRKTRLPEAQRAALWAVFESVHAELARGGKITRARLLSQLATDIGRRKQRPYDYVVVDESQDLSPQHLRFLAALAADGPNGLFFAGDLGQRIFQQPFSWKALGVDIRGRGRTLRINYRTSHQIRAQADKLLGPEVSDVDGNSESRHGTMSVFNGPAPAVSVFATEEAEGKAVSDWVAARLAEGVAPHEIGVFVRSDAQLPRARDALTHARMPFTLLDEHVDIRHGHVALATMHLAKGLEFRAVAVMACDDEVIPLQARIDAVTDDSDLEEVYNTERHLLYVACTRARDQLFVSACAPGSEFLDDLRQGGEAGATR